MVEYDLWYLFDSFVSLSHLIGTKVPFEIKLLMQSKTVNILSTCSLLVEFFCSALQEQEKHSWLGKSVFLLDW